MSTLIPYVQDNGAWSVSDDYMHGIFGIMQEHGLDKTVFANGGIQTKEDFLLFFKNPAVVAHLFFENGIIELMAWLTNFGKNYAMGHFCAFPNAWGRSTKKLGKRTLDYWFNWAPSGEHLLDVIIGQIPANNERAIKYSESIGFKILGTIPLCAVGDKKIGLTNLYITRGDL